MKLNFILSMGFVKSENLKERKKKNKEKFWERKVWEQNRENGKTKRESEKIKKKNAKVKIIISTTLPNKIPAFILPLTIFINQINSIKIIVINKITLGVAYHRFVKLNSKTK